MKTILIPIITFFYLSGHSQTFELKLEGLQKVVFVDHQNNNYESAYGAVYEMEPHNDFFGLYQVERYFKNFDQQILDKYNLRTSKEKIPLKKLPKSDIINLIANINNRYYDSLRLDDFGYTNSYLLQNCRNLASNYYHFEQLEKTQQEYLVEQLSDSSKVMEVLPQCFDVFNTSDYPTCGMLFIYSDDTIRIYTSEQNPYMIPWYVNNEYYNHNPAISTFIASIIPHEDYSNKWRLAGKEFLDQSLTENVYSSYCFPKFKSEHFEELVKNEIDLIYLHFDVSDIKLGSFSSINWDMLEDGDCWNASFRDKDEPSNLTFDVTMINNGDPGSIEPLLEVKDQILKRLHKARLLMDNIKQQEIQSLKIHFTIDKSFSDHAQLSFLKDAPIEIQNQFKTLLDSTIFLTLSNLNGWSRWLIFPDGQIMLWHYFGKSPIDGYTDEQLRTPGGLFKNSFKFFNVDGELLN